MQRRVPGRSASASLWAVAAGVFVRGLVCAVLACALPAHAGPPSIVTPVTTSDLDTLIAQTERGVLVAMASWCGPCKAELPHLVRLHKHYHGKGMAMYGVSVDFAGAQAMQPMVNKFGVEFPVLEGFPGSAVLRLVQAAVGGDRALWPSLCLAGWLLLAFHFARRRLQAALSRLGGGQP